LSSDGAGSASSSAAAQAHSAWDRHRDASRIGSTVAPAPGAAADAASASWFVTIRLTTPENEKKNRILKRSGKFTEIKGKRTPIPTKP